jgi:hypothetical protein
MLGTNGVGGEESRGKAHVLGHAEEREECPLTQKTLEITRGNKTTCPSKPKQTNKSQR